MKEFDSAPAEEPKPDRHFDPAQSIGAQPWWKILHYVIIINPAYHVIVWTLRIYCLLAGIALPFLIWG